MAATPGMGCKGQRQQAARKQDAEFAHELFPCGRLQRPLQSGSVANARPGIAVLAVPVGGRPSNRKH